MQTIRKMFEKSALTSITLLPDEIENPPHVVWIHGAVSSSSTFDYMIQHFPHCKSTLINYSTGIPFYQNLESMQECLADAGPVTVVGHSLGGLYALHLTQHLSVVSGLTISAPFKGSSAADWARALIPRCQLFNDIGSKSSPVTRASEISLDVPWIQLVSTAGHIPWCYSTNDGLVTINSMQHLSDRMQIVKLPVNHYEIMRYAPAIELIKQQINVAELQQ